jgi:hypothetical protein
MAKVKEQQLRMSLPEGDEPEDTAEATQAEVVDSYDHRVKCHTEKVVEILRSSGLMKGVQTAD